MVKYYKSIEGRLCETDKVEDGVWISVINPTETEISDIEEDMGVDRDYIRAALDEEEPADMESEAYEAWGDRHEELEDLADELRDLLDEMGGPYA